MEHTPLKGRPWMPLAMAALGHIIWGFTAQVLRNIIEILNESKLKF